MFTFTAETVVDRPAEDVGRFLADVERYPEWTDMGTVRKLTEGPPRVGTRAEGTMVAGPLRVSMAWELTEVDPARRIAYRTVSRGSLGIDGSYELVPAANGGTLVRAEGTVRMGGILRLLEPILRGEVRRGEARELERMRAILEAEPSTAPLGAPGRP